MSSVSNRGREAALRGTDGYVIPSHVFQSVDDLECRHMVEDNYEEDDIMSDPEDDSDADDKVDLADSYPSARATIVNPLCTQRTAASTVEAKPEQEGPNPFDSANQNELDESEDDGGWIVEESRAMESTTYPEGVASFDVMEEDDGDDSSRESHFDNSWVPMFGQERGDAEYSGVARLSPIKPTRAGFHRVRSSHVSHDIYKNNMRRHIGEDDRKPAALLSTTSLVQSNETERTRQSQSVEPTPQCIPQSNETECTRQSQSVEPNPQCIPLTSMVPNGPTSYSITDRFPPVQNSAVDACNMFGNLAMESRMRGASHAMDHLLVRCGDTEDAVSKERAYEFVRDCDSIGHVLSIMVLPSNYYAANKEMPVVLAGQKLFASQLYRLLLDKGTIPFWLCDAIVSSFSCILNTMYFGAAYTFMASETNTAIEPPLNGSKYDARGETHLRNMVLKRSVSSMKLLSLQMLFFPFCSSGHWTCYAVIPLEKMIIWFDPYSSPDRVTCLKEMRGRTNSGAGTQKMIMRAMELRAAFENYDFPNQEWQVRRYHPNTRRSLQSDGYNCGVIVLLWMRCAWNLQYYVIS